MKKSCLSIVIFLLATTAMSQPEDNKLDAVMQKRQDTYAKYRLHRDSVTVNTWLNIMTTNRYLSEIVYLDSVIRVKNSRQTLQAFDSDALEEENIMLRKQISQKEKIIEAQDDKAIDIQKKLFYGAIAAAVVILLMLLLWFVYYRKFLKGKKNADLAKKYKARLYFAQQKLEEHQTAEKSTESEKSKLRDFYEKKVSLLSDEMEALRDEKLMLENQIVEIKKAWELEVQKTNELQLKVDTQQNIEPEKTANYEKMLEDQQKQLDIADKHLQHCREKLSNAEDQIRGEVASREETEKLLAQMSRELESCQKKVEQDHELQNEKMSTLTKENETMAKELEELKDSQKQQEDMKKEIETDLAQLLGKLKEKYE